METGAKKTDMWKRVYVVGEPVVGIRRFRGDGPKGAAFGLASFARFHFSGGGGNRAFREVRGKPPRKDVAHSSYRTPFADADPPIGKQNLVNMGST